MKRNIYYSLILATIVFIAGCNSGGLGGYDQTASGLYYKYHSHTNDTVTPVLGDLLTLYMSYGTKDSTVFNSKLTPGGDELIIPLEKPGYPGDIYEALAMMKVGDSASFITQADSFYLVTARARAVPAFIDTVDNKIYFEVKMLSAQNQAEFDAAEEEKNKVLRENEKKSLQEYIDNNNITVQPVPSGFYFIESKSGSGRTPKEGDWMKINFEVKMMDGTMLYSTWENGNPMDVEVGKQFDTQAVTEALTMMKEGSVADLIVPSELAFGKEGRQPMIPPFSTILYKIEVIDLMTKEQYEAEKERMRAEQLKKNDQNKVESARFMADNAKKEGVVTLPSGLQYKVIEQGNGPKPGVMDKVKVNYHGTVIDGRVFDSTRDRGEPAEFRVNGVIEGWQEALQLMPVGSKWILYIPPELAYKDNARGNIIEPNMALIFELELLEITEKQ